MPVYKKVNQDFFKKWTAEMAYVLGFFAADGYLTLNKRGAHFWNIQITDGALLIQIKKAIQSDHKISHRKRIGNNNDLYRLQIGSKEMCADLRRLGMRERKTKSLVVPHVPSKYLPDFIRGYFDGDGNVWVGHVHKERKTRLLVIRTVFTSCSGQFLQTIKKKLFERGVDGGVFRKDKDNYYRLTYSIYGSLKLYEFMYNHEVHLRGLFLKRKKRVFEKYRTMRL